MIRISVVIWEKETMELIRSHFGINPSRGGSPPNDRMLSKSTGVRREGICMDVENPFVWEIDIW